MKSLIVGIAALLITPTYADDFITSIQLPDGQTKSFKDAAAWNEIASIRSSTGSTNETGSFVIGVNTRALSKYNVVSGTNSLAGARGYKISSLEQDSQQEGYSIVLSLAENNITPSTFGYIAGDVVSLLINGKNYPDCATIQQVTYVSGDCYLHVGSVPMVGYGVSGFVYVAKKPDVGTAWDVGNYATAEGIETKALKRAAHAEGMRTFAEGDFAHAEGESTMALGEASHAQGYHTIASNFAGFAAGSYAFARHDRSFVWNGQTNQFFYASSTNGSFNVNPENDIGGFFVGRKSLPEWFYTRDNNVITNAGEDSKFQLAIVGGAVDTNSTAAIAIGHSALAEDNRAIAIGRAAAAKGYGAIAIGNAGATNSYAIAIGTGGDEDGVHTTIAEESGDVAIGKNAKAFKGKDAGSKLAIGYGSVASNGYSIAIGGTAKGFQSISIGNASRVDNQNAISIGRSSISEQSENIAIGNQAKAAGAYSIAIGGRYNGYGYGPATSVAQGIGSVIIGSGTVTTRDTLQFHNQPLFQGNLDDNDPKPIALVAPIKPDVLIDTVKQFDSVQSNEFFGVNSGGGGGGGGGGGVITNATEDTASCWRLWQDGAALKMMNCYYNVGGITKKFPDSDSGIIIPASTGFVCLLLKGNTPSIEIYSTWMEIEEAQNDITAYVFPLYRLVDKVPTIDFRTAPQIQAFEGTVP